MSCVRQRSAEKAVRDVKCQQLSTREEERERKKEGNEAGEGGGRVLSAAARLPTKPKFTFGEFGLWGAWLPQTARGHFCTLSNSSAAELSTSRLSTVCTNCAACATHPLWGPRCGLIPCADEDSGRYMEVGSDKKDGCEVSDGTGAQGVT